MLSYEKQMNISGVVFLKSKTYIHAHPHDNPKRRMKIKRDKNIDHLEVGDSFEFQAKVVVTKTDKGHWNFKYFFHSFEPFVPETEEEKNKRLIKLWCGYVENGFKKGYVYKKGMETLKSLGFDTSVYDEEIMKVETKQQEKWRKEKIKQWSDYVRNALRKGYVYEKGVEVLHSLDYHDLDFHIELCREKSAKKALEKLNKKAIPEQE